MAPEKHTAVRFFLPMMQRCRALQPLNAEILVEIAKSGRNLNRVESRFSGSDGRTPTALFADGRTRVVGRFKLFCQATIIIIRTT